jgi:hypothetical protein
MTRTRLLGASLVLGVATACQDPSLASAPSISAADASARAALVAGVQLNRGQIALPAGIRVADQMSVNLARRAINPNDYTCPASTPVTDWYLGEVGRFISQEPALFQLLYVDLLADLIPTYDALLFQTNATPQYFGYRGEFTKTVQKTEREVKGFWDIASSDIQLIGMHGTMLTDAPRVAATYNALFVLPPGLADFFASLVSDGVRQSTTLNGGNHPLFSFNAFAFSSFGGPIPDKIVLGDGVLEGYAAIGYGDVAPASVYAHEFAHHIQYENGYFNDPFATAGSGAEQTRYTELMADAMAGYFLTHKRGGALNRKRVEQFLQVYFQIGDCAFSDPAHHGTPNQRMASARFGFDIADQAQKQGHILSSAEFHDLFVARYPIIVAPDAH